MYPRKLKLGILLDSFDVPAWVDNIIRQVVNGNAGEFKLVILNDGPKKSDKSNGNTIVYSIFNRIDEIICTKEPNPFTLKSAAELFCNVPIIKLTSIKINNDWSINAADIKKIKEYQLDVLIKFGFEYLQCDTFNVSKFGTWFYYHGDDRIMKGGPPGFWEVVENWSETGSALLSAGWGNFPIRVLYRSNFITYPLSPARQRSYYFWGTTSFLPRQISLLQRLGEEKYFQETEKYNLSLHHEIKKYEAPSNILAIKAIAKILIRLSKEFIQRLFYTDHWFLLFSLKKDTPVNFGEFNKIMPSKDKFWADPHTIQVDARYYIFIEEFLKAKNKGYISVIQLDKIGNWKPPVKVLEKNYHLSYPFIFEWSDKYYMVPESRRNKTIDLYECINFPYTWIFKQCLMDNVSAVDTTIIHHFNKWWLFTAIAENESAAPNVELFLFYSDELFCSKWKSHPQNPIISDIKNARPAGSLFVKDGKLFRPSQDCSKAYGYGFDLNEIEILSETEYRERRTLSIRPDWDKKIHATHTFAKQGNLTVIDAFTRARKIL
jgi:hypothetical protein